MTIKKGFTSKALSHIQRKKKSISMPTRRDDYTYTKVVKFLEKKKILL